MTIILRGGDLFDGRGKAPVHADVAIKGQFIESIGRGAGKSGKIMDVGGLAVSPGFVDTHSHSDFSVLKETPESKIFQGVTTEINGNCGLSAAPLLGAALKQRSEDLKGIPRRWTDIAEYLGLLEREGLSINFATLAGHGNIRASVIGYADRSPSAKEMEAMKTLLAEALGAGAIGLSTGLIYPPGVYAKTRELIELSCSGKDVKRSFIYASHMRSEGKRLIEAIKEVIAIGRGAGVKVHISHVKTSGRENWHKINKAVALMENARAAGIRLTCDRYPYAAASTELDAVLPSWVYEGGRTAELKRLKDSAVRGKIKKELTEKYKMKGAYDPYEGVAVSNVGLRKNRWMEGRSIREIASSLSKEPADALIDLLVEEKLKVDAVFHSMSEGNLRRFLSLPFLMVGSDSTARSMRPRGKPHPRAFGTFPRFLGRYAGSLPEAIHKITVLPARTFGLIKRGQLKAGFWADIVVFDPKKIIDRATYDEPFVRPDGMVHVFVNGTPVLLHGKLTGRRPGRVLRHGGE